jgi:O-antigen/teichoic acid export membrane protein
VPDAREAARITVRAVHAGVLVLTLLCPLLWAGAALAIPVLLGTAYDGALSALAVLLPGVAVFGAASALSAWFTNHAGRPWVPALLASLSLAINVVVSVIAIPRIGMVGGALATSLSYSVAVGVAALLFVRASGTPAAVLLRPDWRALAADIGRLRAAH